MTGKNLLDKIELARRARDIRVAEALGLDPALTFDLDVRRDEHEVWWSHVGPNEWPAHDLMRLANGEYPKLGRADIAGPQWSEIEKADEEFLGLFR